MFAAESPGTGSADGGAPDGEVDSAPIRAVVDDVLAGAALRR